MKFLLILILSIPFVTSAATYNCSNIDNGNEAIEIKVDSNKLRLLNQHSGNAWGYTAYLNEGVVDNGDMPGYSLFALSEQYSIIVSSNPIMSFYVSPELLRENDAGYVTFFDQSGEYQIYLCK